MSLSRTTHHVVSAKYLLKDDMNTHNQDILWGFK